MKQADAENELDDFPVMTMGLPPPHPRNNCADHWASVPHTAMRVDRLAKRKLHSPSDCPTPLTELSLYRIKTYPDGLTRTVKDIRTEVDRNASQRILDWINTVQSNHWTSQEVTSSWIEDLCQKQQARLQVQGIPHCCFHHEQMMQSRLTSTTRKTRNQQDLTKTSCQQK